MVKFFKIFILIIVICFFPTKIFGFFATPDKYIHSMPFGVQPNNADAQKLSILLNLNQINNENFNNNTSEKINNDKKEILNSNLPLPIIQSFNNAGSRSISLFWINFWLILFIILLIAVFILLKRKKRNDIIK